MGFASISLRTLVVSFGCMLGTAMPSLAHDFWLMPSAFRVQPDGLVQVRLYHGVRFEGDVVKRDDFQIRRFDMRCSDDMSMIQGMHGGSTSFVRPSDPGHAVLVFQTEEYRNVLPAEKFEAYLEEEGLDEISLRREELGESSAEGREAYVRCAKSLVRVGDAPLAPETAPSGLPFEIMLISVNASEEGVMTFQLLHDGMPLADQDVVAVSASSSGTLIRLRSDEHGHVKLNTGSGGVWMMTSLHMDRTEDREDIDWKSYWASITFEAPRRSIAHRNDSGASG